MGKGIIRFLINPVPAGYSLSVWSLVSVPASLPSAIRTRTPLSASRTTGLRKSWEDYWMLLDSKPTVTAVIPSVGVQPPIYTAWVRILCLSKQVEIGRLTASIDMSSLVWTKDYKHRRRWLSTPSSDCCTISFLHFSPSSLSSPPLLLALVLFLFGVQCLVSFYTIKTWTPLPFLSSYFIPPLPY